MSLSQNSLGWLVGFWFVLFLNFIRASWLSQWPAGGLQSSLLGSVEIRGKELSHMTAGRSKPESV